MDIPVDFVDSAVNKSANSILWFWYIPSPGHYMHVYIQMVYPQHQR